MSVYMIRAGEHGPVKIGFAESVPARLKELQCGHCDELHVIRMVEGGRVAETWFHYRFRAQRIRGEWFTFHPAMLTVMHDVIEVDGSHPDTRRKINKSEIIERIVAHFGGQNALARELGTGQATIWDWITKGHVPSQRIPAVIAAARRLDPPVYLEPNDFFPRFSDATPN